MKKINIRENIFRALENKQPEVVPFTIYSGNGIPPYGSLLPLGEKERYLRNNGMGIVYRMPIGSIINPQIGITEKLFKEKGTIFKKTVLSDGKNSIEQLSRTEEGYNSEHIIEKYIKTDKDYETMYNILKNQTVIPDFKRIEIVQKHLSNDGVVMLRINRCPYQTLCIELIDILKLTLDIEENKEGLLRLMELLESKNEELITYAKESPARIIQVPDNITGPMIGERRFEKYCIPYYNKITEQLADCNKFFCVHMDGLLENLSNKIAECKLPIIEAFTPPPIGNISIQQAREKWPRKIIWINIPGSLFLSKSDLMTENIKKILEGIGSKKNILFGITENFPMDNWDTTINTFLNEMKNLN